LFNQQPKNIDVINEAVTYYEEFKCYYKRKLKEGKPKMLVLNNVRNKMGLRLAAVIKNNKPYQKIAAWALKTIWRRHRNRGV